VTRSDKALAGLVPFLIVAWSMIYAQDEPR